MTEAVRLKDAPEAGQVYPVPVTYTHLVAEGDGAGAQAPSPAQFVLPRWSGRAEERYQPRDGVAVKDVSSFRYCDMSTSVRSPRSRRRRGASPRRRRRDVSPARISPAGRSR